MLRFTVELDRKEYEEVLKLSVKVESIIVNLSPIPFSKSLPTAVSEDKAIAIAKDYAERYKKLCLIKYSSIKTIVIKPTGEVFTEYFYPNIEVNDKYVIFSTANEKLGKVYLK